MGCKDEDSAISEGDFIFFFGLSFYKGKFPLNSPRTYDAPIPANYYSIKIFPLNGTRNLATGCVSSDQGHSTCSIFPFAPYKFSRYGFSFLSSGEH